MSGALFFDHTAHQPYSTRSLHEGGLGGTEATVVRIADALGATVAQRCRVQADGRYVPLGARLQPTDVIVLREADVIGEMAAMFPAARLHLWVHDLLRPGSKRGRRLLRYIDKLRSHQVDIICVSDFQRAQVEALVNSNPRREPIPTRTIYNPVCLDGIERSPTFDPNKLVFFSSPNKGLDLALDAFRYLRRTWPSLRLCVGNPGYKSARRSSMRGVEWLGALAHSEMLRAARDAFAVFHPNFVIPETFGLVLAEANALGVPVLTHDCGAAREILSDARQLLPVERSQRWYLRGARMLPGPVRPAYAAFAGGATVFGPYLERLRDWRARGRPEVRADVRFELARVTAEWRRLLGDAAYN
jgi:glycosyltransferase involved in cell wall biosynthesis